jgi:hypothetical protein
MSPFLKEVCSLACAEIHLNSGLVVVSVVVNYWGALGGADVKMKKSSSGFHPSNISRTHALIVDSTPRAPMTVDEGRTQIPAKA